MAERPDARALLQAAQASVIGELMPLLDAEHRVGALMIAKALSVALRELEAEPVTLCWPPGEPLGDAQVRAALRAGELDDADGSLRAALLEMTRARLRISNPKLLATLETLYGKAPR